MYVKLAPRYYGPFKVIHEINPISFRLELPDHWRIHNAFHVSLPRWLLIKDLINRPKIMCKDLVKALTLS